MFTCDVHIWFLVYDYHMLCSYVKMICDVHMWCSHVIIWLVGFHGDAVFFLKIRTWYSHVKNWHMISYVNFTDIHIWCFCMWSSHVMFTYDFCMWISHVMLTYDNHIWNSHMMFTCDNVTCMLSWCSSFFLEIPHMMSTCEVRNMISYVNLLMFTYDVSVCDVHMWCSHMMLRYVMFTYEVHMWSLVYDFTCELAWRSYTVSRWDG